MLTLTLTVLPLLTALGGAGDLAGSAELADGWQPSEGLQCVYWSQEARARVYGYDHLVHLNNRCKQTATCQVTTNVNPKSIEERLEAGAKQTVLTFMDSPARTFQARVRCEAD